LSGFSDEFIDKIKIQDDIKLSWDEFGNSKNKTNITKPTNKQKYNLSKCPYCDKTVKDKSTGLTRHVQ